MNTKVEMPFQAFLDQKISTLQMTAINILNKPKKLQDLILQESWRKHHLALIADEDNQNIINIEATDLLLNIPLAKKNLNTTNCEDIFHRGESPLSLEQATYRDVLLKFKLATGNVVWIKSKSHQYFVITPAVMIKKIYAYFARIKDLKQISQLDSMSTYDHIFANGAESFSTINNLLYNTEISSVIYATTLKFDEFTSFNDLIGEMRLKSQTSAIITKYDTILAGTITADDLIQDIDKFYTYFLGDVAGPTNYSPLTIHHDTLLFSALKQILQLNQDYCVIINRDNFPLSLLSSIEILRFLALKLAI